MARTEKTLTSTGKKDGRLIEKFEIDNAVARVQEMRLNRFLKSKKPTKR